MTFSVVSFRGLDLYKLLVAEARKEGFPLVGAVDFDQVEEIFSTHYHRYETWIEHGFQGTMEYLVRGKERRSNPQLLLENAQSIFCVGLPYSSKELGTKDAALGARYASYLRGRDYHSVIQDKLHAVMERVSKEWPELKYKVCVDTSGVLERSWAAFCGLGWIGKNTLLIHPQFGSYFFLGEVILDSKVDKAPVFHPNYCGSCRRCLEACPTQAFVEPGNLNSKRCISYLTLEYRGEIQDPELQNKMGNWVAGCDVCQEVCPFNHKKMKIDLTQPLSEACNFPYKWEDLEHETEEQYRLRVKDSALSRIKPPQWKRNLQLSKPSKN